MNTASCSAMPPPASATTADKTAANAIGPRKKPRVRISPTASTPAAIIQITHSSIEVPIVRERAVAGRRDPWPLRLEDRSGEVVGVEGPQILDPLADPDQLHRH